MPTCIIPAGGTDEDVIFTEEPQYAYTRDNYTGKWTLSVSDLKVPSYYELKFSSPALYPSQGYNVKLDYSSPFTATQGGEIERLVAILATDYYYSNGESTVTYLPLGTLTTMAFDVAGKYSVRAFPTFCYYGGALITKYPGPDGTEKEFTNNTPTFGVKVNISSRTAEVSIHNVKFAEEMPMSLSVVTLSGLKLEGDAEDGYKITGRNIVPVVGLGANATPYPSFTFDEFEMHPCNTQMNMAEFEFIVAGRYEGEMIGTFTR